MSLKYVPSFLKFSLLSLLTVFMTGCITTIPIQRLPTSVEAFRASPDQLRTEYPEITEHGPLFKGVNGVAIHTIGAKQLISTWGEPDQKKADWVYPTAMGATLVGCGFLFGPVPALITAGVVIAIRPYPFEYYYWRKADYCIEAKFEYSIVNAYDGSMVYWKWHHMNDGEDIPTECNKPETAAVTTETK